uniref:Lysozyme n=1 Tax=Serratia proteamaculans (strain 568) TaxID=399741 RepID=A8GDE9_SERP5
MENNAIARKSELPKLKPVEMEGLILKRLASVGQKPVADAINLGLRSLSISTLLQKLNVGDKQNAANEFGRWVNAGGVKLNGLVMRRAAERELFLS